MSGLLIVELLCLLQPWWRSFEMRRVLIEADWVACMMIAVSFCGCPLCVLHVYASG